MTLVPPFLGWVAVAVVTLGAVWAYQAGRRDWTVGILLGAATWSAVTAPVGALDIRLEQPATAALGALILLRDRETLRRVLRGTRLPLALVAVFLGAQIVSSALLAPEPAYSLRIAAWMTFSAAAAWVVAVLIVSDDRAGRSVGRGLILAGIVQVAVSVLQVGAEVAWQSNWGVLRTDAPLGKTFGLSWEPNLLSISMAVAICFAVFGTPEDLPGGQRRRTAILATLAVGLGMAVSRGGVVGLVVGLALGILLAAWRHARGRTTDNVWRSYLGHSLIAVGLAVGVLTGLRWLGDLGVGVRPGEISDAPTPVGTLLPIDATPGPPGTAHPSAGRTPAPGEPSPGPTPVGATYYGPSDTITLRVRNMETAIRDALRLSPLIGLGTSSFGQRYVEPSCGCPSHIPNMTAAVIYESGLVGFVALGAAFATLLVAALRAGRIDLVAALIALVIGYQFTDALRFGLTWMLAGPALVAYLAVRQSPARSGTPRRPARP